MRHQTVQVITFILIWQIQADLLLQRLIKKAIDKLTRIMGAKFRKNIKALILVAFVGSVIVNGQNIPVELVIENRIDSIAAGFNNPDIEGGFAIAVIKDGKIIFKKGYGFANVENAVPFTTSTICDFASISKQFTGFAVAKLISDGLIYPNDDIRKFLTELPDYGVTITIRHLLGHMSGVRDFVPLLKLSGHQDGDVVTDEYLMKLILNQKELNFTPGEQHLYSNSGYFLLAHIVAKVTGMTFNEWITKNIFIPLGMESTQYLDYPGKIIRNRAQSYSWNAERVYNFIPDNLSAIGSSSLFSSTDDMIKWVMNLITNEVGGKKIFDMMCEPSRLNNGERIGYNFGIETGKWEGHSYLRHGGSWGGFLSDIICFPHDKAAIVLITNRDPLRVMVTQTVQELLFNVVPEPENESGTLINEDKPRKTVKKEIIDNYVGDYVFKSADNNYLYRFAKVSVTTENFIFNSALARNNRLYAETDRKFFIVGADNRYEFVCDEKGKCTTVKANIEGSNYVFNRIYPFFENREQVGEYPGEYYSEEINSTYFIDIKDNSLIVRSLLNEDVHLSMIEKDLYVSDRWWFREIRFTRDESKRIDGFVIQTDNGNITKSLKFQKKLIL